MDTSYIDGYEGGVLIPEKVKNFSEVEKINGGEASKKINSIEELNDVKIEKLNLQNTLEFDTKSVLQNLSGYYGMDSIQKEGYLTTTKTQEEINKYFNEGTFESDIVLPFHRAFNNDSVSKILGGIKKIENQRILTLEEKKVLDFISNIEQFFEELTEKIDNIKNIDFSRIKNVGYYAVKEGELEYSKQVLEMFNDFVEFINKSSKNYDFIVNRLTDEGLINKGEEKKPKEVEKKEESNISKLKRLLKKQF